MTVLRRSRFGVASALSVAFLCVSASMLSGCAQEEEYSSLAVGECLPKSAEVVGRREPDPPRVPCSTNHRYEVYWVAPLQLGDTFPGVDPLDAAAKQLCVDAFEDGVGIAPLDLPDGVKMLYLAPSEQSWTDDADREVECLVVFDEDRSERFVQTGRV